MTVSAALTGGTLELGTGLLDTFLRHVLPADGIVVPFDVGLAWSRQGGITLVGTTGLVITRTLTVRIGPITVDELRVVLVAGPIGDGILTLDVSASLVIGPFAATVEHVGWSRRADHHGRGEPRPARRRPAGLPAARSG